MNSTAPVKGEGLSPWRRLYRQIYWAPTDAAYWREIRHIRTLVYLGGGGIGDSLNCSAVLHELDRRQPGETSMMTPHPELFEANPHVRSLHSYDPKLIVTLGRWRHRTIHPAYHLSQEQPPRVPTPADHIVAQLCRSAGLHGTVALRPWFYFHPGERERFTGYRDAVVVQSSILHARHALPAKNWPATRMQVVVDTLRQRGFRLVQLGHRDDVPLVGTEDLRGRLPLREVAALLSHARCFVGLVGFLMHLTRAVETRAVIVYGGREHPLQSGYIANENLYGQVSCAPCGIDDECRIGHPCMLQIQPDQVLAAFDRLAARHGQPLEHASVTLD